MLGDTMLLDAAKHGNVKVMEKLLEKMTIPIDHVNKKGDSALIRAAWKGETATLQLLMKQSSKFDINYLEKTNKMRNALQSHIQIGESNPEIVKLLLDCGINLDHQDQEGNTALLIAVKLGQETSVKQLVEGGAN